MESAGEVSSAAAACVTAAGCSAQARVVVQQCVSARLQTNFDQVGAGDGAEFVEIGNGMVVFVCFLKEADDSVAERLSSSVMKARLCRSETSGKKVSVLDRRGDVMIVPQATLGGSLKGKQFQYHKNTTPELGASLFKKFVDCVQQAGGFSAPPGTSPAPVLAAGTYGNRQILTMTTNGPATHIIEL